MFQRLKNILIGEPLTHDDSGDEHLLSKIQALAMLSSDALSSIRDSGYRGCGNLVVNPYWAFGSRPFGQPYHLL